MKPPANVTAGSRGCAHRALFRLVRLLLACTALVLLAALSAVGADAEDEPNLSPDAGPPVEQPLQPAPAALTRSQPLKAAYASIPATGSQAPPPAPLATALYLTSRAGNAAGGWLPALPSLAALPILLVTWHRRRLADRALGTLAAELGLNGRHTPRETAATALLQLKTLRQRLHVLERSHRAQARALSERVARLEKSKLDFLKVASHELRAPLTVLSGYVSMLEEGALGELPEALRPVVPILGAKSSQMNLLIDQMLETARLEDSFLTLRLDDVNLVEVAREALATVRPLAGSTHRLVFEAASDLVCVRGDKARLGTILTNLLDNALKYSPEGGRVRVSVGASATEASVAVSDQGMGIDAADMHKLFTRFGRIVTPENSHIPGTGLGLYLARELARLHGGDVIVRSWPMLGSSFVFTMPVPATAGDLAASGSALLQ